MDQSTIGVELQIWREKGEGGVWRCRVMTPCGHHTVRLDDQEALNTYITGQIDMFVRAYEMQGQLIHGRN
jgi:hypothetical protein